MSVDELKPVPGVGGVGEVGGSGGSEAGPPSLVTKQIALLRNKNEALQNKLESLVAIARTNENLSIGLHRLSLRLVASNSVHEVAAISLAELRQRLPGNQIVIRLLGKYDPHEGLNSAGKDSGAVSLLHSLAATGKPDCGPFDNAVKLSLFGRFAQRAASAVVMPLVADDERFGLLALGSADGDSFSAGKGTMFLVQFGELIACALRAGARRENRAG